MNQSQRAQSNFHSKNLKFTVSTKKDKNRQYIFLHQPNFMGVFNILVFVYGAKLVFEKQIDLKKKLVMSERPCQDFRDTKEEKNIT